MANNGKKPRKGKKDALGKPSGTEHEPKGHGTRKKREKSETPKAHGKRKKREKNEAPKGNGKLGKHKKQGRQNSRPQVSAAFDTLPEQQSPAAAGKTADAAKGALSQEFFDARKAQLQERVTGKRFAHVLGVVAMAERLALEYDVDVRKARLAALLHDWDKGYDDEGIRARVCQLDLDIDPWLADHMPRLLHGPTAACALHREFPAIPSDVLRAIERHTTGAPDMGPLDMVVYVADALEEGRPFNRVTELRSHIGTESLEELFVEVLGYWTILIIGQGRPLHPATAQVWNSYVMKNQKPYRHREERK